jgi:hypothetical protein
MTTTTARTNYGWFYLEETGFGWLVVDKRTNQIHRNPLLGDLSREQADALAYGLYAKEVTG